MSTEDSPLEKLSRLPPDEREAIWAEEARKHGLSSAELKSQLLRSWRFLARPKQLPPEGDWTFWWVNAGRGFGKTVTGAQWTKERGLERRCRIALVAPTLGDVRATMVEGEALALDTLVQTPDGTKTMGDLRDGDLVLGGDGRPCRVVHAHPVLLGRSCYRVRLKGGVEIVADGNHRWLTEDWATRACNARYTQKPRRPGEVRTTEELRSTLRYYSGAASQANHGIPISAFAWTSEAELPIDPYVLGAWLGDGLSKSGAICDAEGDVVREVEAAGYTIRLQPSSGTVAVYGILGLQSQLRAAGLIRNKHVPASYFRASWFQRLALVQGLMDTDGYVSERGQCEFVSKNRALAEALVDLLCGLGAKASAPRPKETNVGTTHWLVKFTTTLPVVRMPRKAARLPETYRDAAHWYVADVEPVESVPVRCITVDSPDSTYLVTRHYVRTHNTGLLSVLPNHALLGQSREVAWNKSLLQVTLANGTILQGFSSETPNRLRGPQHHYAWLEEVSSFNDANSNDPLNTTWSNLKLGLRLGEHPRAVLTSTPKANRLTRELAGMAAAGDGVLVGVHGSSYENRANLSEAWWRAVILPLEGTRTGRQEIEAELLDDVEGALWTRAMIDALRVAEAPLLKRVVVGVDPNTTSGETADDAGIVVVGEAHERDSRGYRHAYVLADRTTIRGGPAAWAVAAARAYHEHEGDRIVAEKNNGGEMVSLVLAGVDNTLPIVLVSASHGKLTRAEPVAALYSPVEGVRDGLIHHVGPFAELEDEMTTYTGEGESPNRMDALVWALWYLKQWRPTSKHRGGLAKGTLPGTQMGTGLGDLAGPTIR